jgi:uncharacterized caspase-like protein
MDNEDYPEVEHAPFSPSSLKFFELCPSWAPGDSEEAGEEAAIRGTAMHKTFETEDFSHCQTDEERECAKQALRYVEYIKRRRLAGHR